MASTAEKTNVGRLTQIIGPVVDVEFTGGKMPQIYSALKIDRKSTRLNSSHRNTSRMPSSA